MTINKTNVDPEGKPNAKRAFDPDENEAAAELLEHIAEELAREYVRLMEAAVKDDTDLDKAKSGKE